MCVCLCIYSRRDFPTSVNLRQIMSTQNLLFCRVHLQVPHTLHTHTHRHTQTPLFLFLWWILLSIVSYDTLALGKHLINYLMLICGKRRKQANSAFRQFCFQLWKICVSLLTLLGEFDVWVMVTWRMSSSDTSKNSVVDSGLYNIFIQQLPWTYYQICDWSNVRWKS